MTSPTDDAVLSAEIDRRCRQRMVGVYLALGAAALLLVGVANARRMMHGGHPSAATGRIVAVETDPRTGQTLMTSEFADASGTLHRDTQTDGYHYAPGPPVVGQHIGYLYESDALTGDVYAYPRADRLLQWMFGVPMALFVLMATGGAWLVLRQRNLRRRLLREGRRERPQAPSIRRRTLAFPTGNRTESVPMWRLEARYFEPARSAFVDCHSDWQAGEAPDLRDGTPLPPLLVDPARPSRHWLPVGGLASP